MSRIRSDGPFEVYEHDVGDFRPVKPGPVPESVLKAAFACLGLASLAALAAYTAPLLPDMTAVDSELIYASTAIALAIVTVVFAGAQLPILRSIELTDAGILSRGKTLSWERIATIETSVMYRGSQVVPAVIVHTVNGDSFGYRMPSGSTAMTSTNLMCTALDANRVRRGVLATATAPRKDARSRVTE